MPLIHALNRGTDKRDIFMDDHDRMRFCYGLFLFNDTRHVDIAALKTKGLPMSFFVESTPPRKRLVDVHGWCLMTNHYHLLLSERTESGVSRFLQKLNIGYAKYFNDRHKRVGTLYQGRTKQVLIESDRQFLHILNYIHFNPLDFLNGSKEWRERRISNTQKALDHLNKYRWSSYATYCGKGDFPAITTTELFADVFKDYKREVVGYLHDIEIESIQLDGLNLE